MRIFCTYCGAANAEGAPACAACGTRIAHAPAPAPAPWGGEPAAAGPLPGYPPAPDYTQPYGVAVPSTPDYTQPYGVGIPPTPGSRSQAPEQQPYGVPDFAAPAYPQQGYPQQPYPPPYPQQPYPQQAYAPPGAPYGQTPLYQPGMQYPVPSPQTPPYGQAAYQAHPTYGQDPAYGLSPYSQPMPYGPATGPLPYPVAPGYGAALATGGPGSLASTLPRFGAFLFDSVMYLVIAFIALSIVGALNLPALGAVLVLGLHPVYHIGFWATTGRTPGYKAAGLQLIKADGTRPGWGAAVVRYVGWQATNLLFYLGCLWMIWDYKKQALYDKMANTLVIRA